MHLQVCGQLLVDFREQLGEWGLTMSHLSYQCTSLDADIIAAMSAGLPGTVSVFRNLCAFAIQHHQASWNNVARVHEFALAKPGFGILETGRGYGTWCRKTHLTRCCKSVVISHPFMVEFQITTGGDDGMKITGFLHITGSRPSILNGYSIPLCHHKSIEWTRCFFLQNSEWCAIQWSILSNYIYIY